MTMWWEFYEGNTLHVEQRPHCIVTVCDILLMLKQATISYLSSGLHVHQTGALMQRFRLLVADESHFAMDTGDLWSKRQTNMLVLVF